MSMPSDLDAERIVLSAAMTGTEAASVTFDAVTAECFTTYRPIFEAIARLLDQSAPTDPIAVKGELDRSGLTNLANLLVEILAVHGLPSELAHYVARLKAVHRRRALLVAGMRLAQLGERSDLDADQVETEAAKHLETLSAAEPVTASTAKTAAELAWSYLDWLENGRAEAAVPTGFADLDRLTNGGFRPGQFVIVAARPGIGKSILLLNFVRHAAVTLGRPTLLASIEMGHDEVMARLFAQIARLP